MKTLALIVAGIIIRQDSEGRFCLNDLHKASGNNPNHQPKEWLSNQPTIEMINELSGISPIEKIKGGNNQQQGTYIVKDLVYAYAMWISPAFHLQVIRAYDALVTKPRTPGQIYLALANDLRLSLPDLAITDRAVLISDNQGQVNMSGETREQLRYYKEMDKLNLPGIIAVTRKPYKVLFDWFNNYKHSEETRESVYQALSDRCAWYKSIHYGYKPFKNHPTAEEVYGIKNLQEVNELAADMAKIVANLLANKPGNNQTMQHAYF